MPNKRLHLIDTLRGLALVSMIIYHAFWSMENLFGKQITLLHGTPAYLWQQSTAALFIFISGFCWRLTHKHLKRSLTVLGCAVFIFLFTYLFDKNNAISFGILAFIGSAAIIMPPFAKILKHLPPTGGLILSIVLFFLTKHIPHGYFGIYNFKWQLPQNLYSNYFTAYIGLPPDNFYSADYFPLLPWLFMYIAGYFANYNLQKFISRTNIFNFNIKPLSLLGRHSLTTYLIHQPLIYCLLWILLKYKI